MSESIDLTLERLNRLEQAIAEFRGEVGTRLDGVESALEKIVTVLEAHDQRLEHIVGRLDRLMEQTIRARTEDAKRMEDVERRLAALERRDESP